MAELVQEGKCAYLGLSEATGTIRRAHASSDLARTRSLAGPEAEILPRCASSGSALSPTARSAAASSRRIRSPTSLDEKDFRGGPRFQERLRRNLELVAVVEDLAAEKGADTVAVALAWVLTRGVTSSRSRERSAAVPRGERGGAAEIELTAGRAAQLEQAFPVGAAAGDRYPICRRSTEQPGETACARARAAPAPSPRAASSRSGRCSGSCRSGAASAQVAERGCAGARAGREQGLDRPGRRLRVGAPAERELEAAVAVLMAPEKATPRSIGAPRDAGGAQRLDRGGRVVRVAAPPASHDQPPEAAAAREERATRAGGAGSPACRSARIVQIVAFTSLPAGARAAAAAGRPAGRPAAARAIATSATSVAVVGCCLARYSAAPPVSAPAATSPSVAHAVICASPKPPSSRCCDWT